MPEATQDPRPPLPTGYYEINFRSILDTVTDRYMDLLRPDERAFASVYKELTVDARRLYVRLISRKGPLFRMGKLNYPEIESLDDARQELITAGFIDDGLDTAIDTDIDDWLALLLKQELLELLKHCCPNIEKAELKSLKRRPHIVEFLLQNTQPESKKTWISTQYTVMRPKLFEHILVYRLLFFGNIYQDLTEFVLQDIGMTQYEPYPLERAHRLFPHRLFVDKTFEWVQRRDLVYLLLDAGQLEDALAMAEGSRDLTDCLPSADEHSSDTEQFLYKRCRRRLRRLRDHILNSVGRALERAERFEEALTHYQLSQSPPARERRCRILVKQQRSAEALEILEAITQDPWDEGERVFAPGFQVKALKALGQPAPKIKRRRRPKLEMALTRDITQPIESQVIEALLTQGKWAFHSENWFWRSLFGLAFWDIIFKPLPGVFQHPFQRGPLDLHSPDFRRQRQSMIDQRLAQIAAFEHAPMDWLETYDAKWGTVNAFVAWDSVARDGIAQSLPRISGPVLAAVFDSLSKDLRRYGRGFPDLLVWDEAQQKLELMEVKGPGDQLRPEQRHWIDTFNDAGLPCAVARISWTVTEA